jgi:hypothetical protein
MFKTVLKNRFQIEEKKKILYMRIFIVLFGAVITFGSMLFAKLPGTVIGLAMLMLG